MRQIGWAEVLECAPLAEVAHHCFTMRDVDFRAGRPDAESAWHRLARHLEVASERLYRLRQVHGVAVVEPPRDGEDETWLAPPEADVIVNDRVDAGVAVQTADCVAILAGDTRRAAVAAVHAGWRGTAARVASVAVEALKERLGSAPADLVIAIGPSIGPCCYEVGDEVREAFLAVGHPPRDVERWFVRGPSGRWRLDLWSANVDQLESAGVRRDRIHLAEACTATEVSRFFSYRREGPSTGRLVAAIRPRAR